MRLLHSDVMTAIKTTGLYWFRHDLRLADNPSLNQLCSKVDRLICVYIKDQHEANQSQLCRASVSQLKKIFEQQSVTVLDESLRQKNQYLLCVGGPVQETLLALVERYAVTHIGAEFHPGVYEQNTLKSLQDACPQVHFTVSQGHTLFSINDLPFDLEELPETFTPFRKKVETILINPPADELLQLPSSIGVMPEVQQKLTSGPLQGGEKSAHQQLNYYLFESDLIKQYKQTRNALDDWHNSSKLSLWLANGCISAKTIYQTIKQYEAERGVNESTYWLYFELLWREYFQWYLNKHQNKLFHFSGVKQVAPLTRFNQQEFTRWCEGMTEYPVVNACMRQLNQTGYMSNRGRQLVASCLVHELNLDWRYGAAYFEQQLIDYDVASNWGNWQYLAGVGADPRGHRRFALDKHTATYDPAEVFRKKSLASDE